MRLSTSDSITFEVQGLAEITLSKESSVGSSMQFASSPDIKGYWKIQRDGIDNSIVKFKNYLPGIVLITQPGISMFYQGKKTDIVELVKAVFDGNKELYKNIIGILFIARSVFGDNKNWQYEYDLIQNDNCIIKWEECSLYNALQNINLHVSNYKNISDYAIALGQYRIIKAE